MQLKFIFRAMRHRNYRLFICGQSISLIGTWMQQVAMSWLVYRLTNSALLLGVVGFAGQIPSFLLAPLAGVIADRHHRHRILLMTQTSAMLQAVVLSVLVLNHQIAVWHILVLSVFLGLVNAFDMPIRQSFMVEMIEKREDLSNAIALNSSIVNMARLVGPSIAGVLIALVGEGMCFLLNAASYIAVIAALMAMKITPKKILPKREHVLHDLKEGFLYAFGFTPIKSILLLLSLVSLMGVPYQVLMPVFARDIFHGGPKTLGFLMAMSGSGALAGAIYLASRKSVIGLGRMIAVTTGVFGLGMVIFALSNALWFSLVVVGVSGFSMMVQMAASNTILQTIVEEDKRGRVMSFYTMSIIGMTPFGSLMAGTLADRIGAPATLLIGGVCCVLGAAIFVRKLPAIRAKVRPIYIKKGIIPEVVSGIGAASEPDALPKK
ncbi:MAG: MFS transporter [Candidatus Omnitrophica bacterium]|nr:MFS transporter [Candidatus Omnitrophota bacterium]MDD5671367.1 MFS transporter [Candidatus Omnitrophota bacterium]